METFNAVIELIRKFVAIGGGLWLVWGVVVLGIAMKDHNGPGMQAGIWQIIGGGMVIAAATLFAGVVGS